MKRRVRVYKPCPECGSSIDHSLEQGGAYLPVVDQDHLHQVKSGGDWIQKATTSFKEKGTEGRCTGSKFGGPDCPKGSKQYNLAVTFRNMAKGNKRQFGGTSTALQNTDVTDFGKNRLDYFKNHIAEQAGRSIVEDEFIGFNEELMQQAASFQTGGGTQKDWGDYGYVGNELTEQYLDIWQNNQDVDNEVMFNFVTSLGNIKPDRDHWKFETKNNPNNINKTVAPKDNKVTEDPYGVPVQLTTPEAGKYGYVEPNYGTPKPPVFKPPTPNNNYDSQYAEQPITTTDPYSTPINIIDMNLPKNKYDGLIKAQKGLEIPKGMAHNDIPLAIRNNPYFQEYYKDKGLYSDDIIPSEVLSYIQQRSNGVPKDQVTNVFKVKKIQKPTSAWDYLSTGAGRDKLGRLNFDKDPDEYTTYQTSNNDSPVIPNTNKTIPNVAVTADKRLNSKTVKRGNVKQIPANTSTPPSTNTGITDDDVRGTQRGNVTDNNVSGNGSNQNQDVSRTNNTDYNRTQNPYGHVSKINYRRAIMPGNRIKSVIFHHHNGQEGYLNNPNQNPPVNVIKVNENTGFNNFNNSNNSDIYDYNQQPANRRFDKNAIPNNELPAAQYGGNMYEDNYNVGPYPDFDNNNYYVDEYGREIYQIGGGTQLGTGAPEEDQDNTADWNDPWGSEYARTRAKHHKDFSTQGALKAAGKMVGPAIDFAAMIGRKITEPDWEKKIQNSTSAENVFTPMMGDRGFNTFNKVGYDPGTNGIPVQFKGMARRGGALTQMFEEGGSYELTEDQITEFMRAGGQIEYLD